MSNITIDDFESLYNKIARAVTGFFFGRKYSGGYLMVCNEEEFIGKISEKISLKIIQKISVCDNNFPQMYFCSFYLYKDRSIILSSCGRGFFENKDLAIIKSKGEFLERLSTFIDIDIMLRNKWEIDITTQQMKKVLVRSLTSFSFKYLNPAYIYYGVNIKKINPNISETIPKHQLTSNGSAGHFSYKKAILGGWLELIERDSFFMYWLNTISPKIIDIKGFLLRVSIDNEFLTFKKLISDFSKYNISYYFLDTTTDLDIPSVCCVLVTDSPTGKRIGVGMSAGFDGVTNLLSASVEANVMLSIIYNKPPLASSEDDFNQNYKNTLRMKQRWSVYTTDFMYTQALFFIEGKEEITFESWSKEYMLLKNNPEQQLTHLKNIFKLKAKDRKEYNVFVYKIHNRVLSLFDYKVVKVICDGLYGLYLDEVNINFDHPRLKEFVENKNLTKIAKKNTVPHPFI